MRPGRLLRTTALLLLTVAQVDWPLRHGDARNSDSVEAVAADQLEPAWFHGPDVPIGTFAAVDGDLVFFSSYNADDKPAGEHAGCRLWALDAKTGDVRWCNKLVGAALTSVALDGDLGVFVADRAFLYRFSRTGQLIWRTPVQSETSSLSWTSDRLLINADYSGAIALYDPETGGLVSEPFILPATPYPRGHFSAAEAPGQLTAGVGPDYLPHLIDNFFGYGVVIKDMPVVVPGSDRIFVAGNLAQNGVGALFGIDITIGPDGLKTLKVACTITTGPNSDTSPAVTADGRTLYTAAADRLFAINTRNCTKKWEAEHFGMAASSPTILPDGRVILMAGGAIAAFRDTGDQADLIWTLQAKEQAQAEGFVDGIFNSVVVAAGSRLYVTATYGPVLSGIVYPDAHRVFVIDAGSGSPLSTARLGAESDSTPSISRDGWVYIPTKSLAHAHWISEKILGRLPAKLEGLELRDPDNGLYAFSPAGDLQP